MNRLENKVAIITGAARGQGEATARLFASEGCAVVMTDVLAAEGEAVASAIGERARFVRQDVSSEADWNSVVQTALSAFGKIDILINNAAIAHFGAIEDTSKDDLMRLLSVNVVGQYLGIKAVLPLMKEARRGSIVNISSVDGLRGTTGLSAYDACKWGVRGMSKAIALEAAPFNVRVNTVHPGAIDTPMLNPTGAQDTTPIAQGLGIPFGRVGQSPEVAAASLFLASDDASYISGAELAVDGAWTAGLNTNIEKLD
jgi:3alpha(or 20beta)-hydroxysteroid dehydrogenase